MGGAGYSILVMDTRGQGGRWTTGGTGDGPGRTGPENSKVMTRGIASPEGNALLPGDARLS